MESSPKKQRKTEEDDGKILELPPEIIEAIISRVPAKPLCRFKLVSKSWHSLISDPDFVANYNKDVSFQRRRLLFTIVDSLEEEQIFGERYRNLYSLDVDKFLNENHNGDSLLAASTELHYFYNDLDPPEGSVEWSPIVPFSCHGLFMSELHSSDTDITLILSNPVIQKSKLLSEPPVWERAKILQWWLFGLGFDYSTSEHKVIYGQDYEDYGIMFSVYTLQTDCWRKINRFFPYEGRAFNGIEVNGAVHWVVKKIAVEEYVIIRFLLAEEKVEEIELPPNCKVFGLESFRNSLCLTSFSHEESETCNEFWIMKEYGVRESWTKMKVPKPYKKLSHSGFWTETQDLMVFDMKSLVMCNFRDGTSWDLPIGYLGEDCVFGSVGVYVESLPSKVETTVCRNEIHEEA